MAKMNKDTFSQLEEVGYRIKATRVKNKLRASAVSQGRIFNEMNPGETAPTMTSSSYTNVEKGKGSLVSLDVAQKLAGVNTSIAVKYSVSNRTNKHPLVTQLNTGILGLHDLAKKVRQEKLISISELSKAAGTTYSSVVVFEKTDKATIYSTSRYLAAMGVDLVITVTDARDNQPINPSKDMPIIRYEKLVEEFEDFLELNGSIPSDISIQKPVEASQALQDDFMTDVGAKLKELRTASSQSRVKLAEKINSSEIMIMQVEKGKSSLASSNDVAKAFNKKIVINLTGKAIRNIEETNPEIKTKKIEVDELTVILDQIRQAEEITVSDFAKKIGTTYRSVDIFPKVIPHKKSLMRYIDGLNIRAKMVIVKS